jgi:hypothetical protein
MVQLVFALPDQPARLDEPPIDAPALGGDLLKIGLQFIRAALQ